MKLLIFFTFLILFQNTQISTSRVRLEIFTTYCNPRFGYCIDYPEFLIPQRESENGDGKIFTNKEGQTILTVFGRLNRDIDGNEFSLKKQYNSDINDLIKSKDNITYRKLEKTFYILSGKRNGKIFYLKTIIKGNAFCFALLEYQESDKAKYDSVSIKISKSFK